MNGGESIVKNVARELVKNKTAFFLSIGFLFTLFACSFHRSIDVAKELRNLSDEDRENLEWFFRGFWESSYVLFGTKPMAFTFIKDPHHPHVEHIFDFMDSITDCHPSAQVEIKGWEVWKKYNHLFKSSNFIFLENQEEAGNEIFVINKRSFLDKVGENLDCFQEVLGRDVTPEQILELCLKSKNIIKDALKGHDGLLGILLGFGRHNSYLYWRANQIKSGCFPKWLAPSSGFSTLEEEYAHINGTLTFFPNLLMNDLNPFLLDLPEFRADQEHPETEQLRKEYLATYKTILKSYENGNILETTLRQFCD